MQHLGMRDWYPDFEQTVLLYNKPLNKGARQQRNMDGVSFVWPPRAHGHHVRGKFAGQPIIE